jgi:AcrR family transcriptional regulator
MMDDVAKRANLSRPLIYLKFTSKQDLVRGICFDFMKPALEQAESILRSKISAKAKLAAVVDAINVRAWEKVVGQPMTKEFYPLCERQLPEESERFERQRVKIYQQLLGGDKALAEAFVLAIDGFCADTPSVKALRARIGIMIDRFCPDG